MQLTERTDKETGLGPRPQPLTILVLEDHHDYRQLLAAAVIRAGHRVVEAVDGLDGLAYLAHNEAPDLILCDLRMPRMDGEEFIAALRASASLGAIPVVLISAEPQAEAVAQRHQVAFLQKSRFSPLKDLPGEVRRHCPSARAEPRLSTN